MSILDHAAAARVRIFARAARDASVLAGIALLLDALRTEIRSRKAERALYAMSDRSLKDIGVARCAISQRVRSIRGQAGDTGLSIAVDDEHAPRTAPEPAATPRSSTQERNQS